MADAAILAAGGGHAPLSYLVPGTAVLTIKQVHVKYADDGASGDWLPAVRIVNDAGHTMGTAADQGVKVTAGDDADVSFFPGVKPGGSGSTALNTQAEWGQVYRGFVDAAQTVAAGTSAYAQWLHLKHGNQAQDVFEYGTIVAGNDGITFNAKGMYLCLASATWDTPTPGLSIHIQPAAQILNYSGDAGWSTVNGTNTTVFDWQLVIPQNFNQKQGVLLSNADGIAHDVAGVSLGVYYWPNPIVY